MMIELSGVKIDCYLSHICGSENELREHLTNALIQEETEAEIIFHRVDAREAKRLGLKGSPSIFIEGEDIQPISAGEFT